MIKSKVAFLEGRAGFYPANQSNLKTVEKALIGCKKPFYTKNKSLDGAMNL